MSLRSATIVDAPERLDYPMERLLAEAGITRSDLDDPDARVPCTVWVPMLCRALEERPMKNAGMRLAAETPIGAFPLIDYLIMTSHDVGEGLTRLARYLRLGEAPSIPSVREDEDPIRVVFEGRDTPLSAEFSVTIDLLHLREETEGRFRAAYASFSHTPDDVVEMERVLDCPVHAGASWNGWALARETWALPLRRSDPVLSGLLQRQADEAISRLPPMDGVALDVRRALASRVGGGDTRIQAIARLLATSSRSLQRRLAAAGSPISNCSIMRAGTRPNAIWRIRGCRLARSHICLAIRSPPPLTGRSGDGITRRRRRFATGNEANALECRHPLRPRSDSQPVAAIRPSLTESAIDHHADARATTTTTRTCRLKVFTASSETAATTCRSSTTGGFTGRTI